MDLINFQMPENIEIEENSFSDTFGKFIIQPLERGFGHTMGNALRRVLLSSLSGAAISSIKVDGVLHEFTTIPGVMEDVAEMILNLKQLRFKLLGEESVKIRLNFKGAGEFTGATIQENHSEYEVLNPDLHIANMNDQADFSMEVVIQRGRGYVSSEENRNADQPIGTIPLDSIYTPVVNVTYKVENTRVGQRVDYEKLTIEISTDGSVTPDDALTFSGKLLRDHIQLFINFDLKSGDDEDEDVDEETLRIRKLLNKSVEELELSVRSSNCLKEAKIKTIADLVCRDESEMLKFKNFGRKSLMELTEILHSKELDWGMNVERYLGSQNKKNED